LAYNLALILIKQKIIKSIGHLYPHNGIFSSTKTDRRFIYLYLFLQMQCCIFISPKLDY